MISSCNRDNEVYVVRNFKFFRQYTLVSGEFFKKVKEQYNKLHAHFHCLLCLAHVLSVRYCASVCDQNVKFILANCTKSYKRHTSVIHGAATTHIALQFSIYKAHTVTEWLYFSL